MLTKDSIINHLGKNPKKGGSPPKESRDKNKINLITELLLNKTNICLMWNNLKLLNKNTIQKDKKEQRKK